MITMECAYELCNKELAGFPYTCAYCNLKFCIDHRLPEMHNCIKTRYVKYVRKSWLRRGGTGEGLPRQALNISSGHYQVTCEDCGYTGKISLIEIAGLELETHMETKGCQKVFLKEV